MPMICIGFLHDFKEFTLAQLSWSNVCQIFGKN